MRKFHLIASLLVIFALLLAACSSTGEEKGEGTPGSNLGTPEESTEAIPGTGATAVLPGTGVTPAATSPVATLPAATEVMTATTAAAATPAAGATSAVTATVAVKNSPLLASNWFGRDIKNANGDDLGEVKGFVLNENSGNIQYAILGAGGFLGIGEKLILVPFGAFKVDPMAADEDHMVTLNVDQNALKGAPNFDKLPDMTAPNWDKDILSYWASVIQPAPATTPVATGHFVQVMSLGDLLVQNVACNDIGNVEDLILDAKTGQIKYALVKVNWEALNNAATNAQTTPMTTAATTPVATPASSSAAGQMDHPNGDLVLIPWNAFVGHNQVGQMGSGQGQSGGGQTQPSTCMTQTDKVYLILDTSKVDLTQAPAFKSVDMLPDLSLPDWDKDIQTFWSNIHS